jgi:hypothetical protein
MTKHPTRTPPVNKSAGIGKGTPGPGRPKGLANKTTVAAKEAFTLAAQGIGGVEALTQWGAVNPDKFWPLYARLIPTDVTSAGEKLVGTQTIIIGGRTIEF